MDFNEVVLSFGLAYLGLAVLVWGLSRPITGESPLFSEAALSTVLMMVFGGVGAVLLGALYNTVQPAGVWILVGHAPLVGWQVALDEGLVWTLGLGIGYVGALQLTTKGRLSRRLVLAVVAAAASPVLLIGAEMAVEWGTDFARGFFGDLSL